MGFPKPGFLFLAINILIPSVAGRQITNCFLSNFDNAEITFTYNESGEPGTLQMSVNFGLSAVTNEFTIDETAPAQPQLTDNYVIGSCNEDFRFCKVHAGILFNYDVRAEIAKANGAVGLVLRTTTQAEASAVQCMIDGRNVDILPPGDTLASPTDASTLSLGVASGSMGMPFAFPMDGDITGLIPENTETDIAIEFSYSSGSSQRLGTAAAFGAATPFSAGDVKTVEITSETTDGQFCGLELKDENDESLATYNGCSNGGTPETVTIAAGYRLLGFMQYGSDTYKLVPVQYQRVSPRIMYYQSQDSSTQNLEIFWKSFFGTESVTYGYSYMTGLKSEDGTIEKTTQAATLLPDSSAPGASAGRFTISPSDISCGCYDVAITFTKTVPADDTFQYNADEDFKAWTTGFTENTLTYGSTGNNLLTGTSYVTYSVDSGKCPEMYPRAVATGGSNEIYIDGWIGARPSSDLIPTAVTEITKPIIQVDVHGTETDNVATITGLALTLAGDTEPSINVGDVSQGLLNSLVAPTNHYLKSIIGYGDPSNSEILRGISAVYGQPKGPCFVLSTAAEEYTTNVPNADMRKVYWYAPVDCSKVVADITGKLVADPSETLKAEIVPVGEATELDRGQVFEAYLYHLKPNTGYSFTLTCTNTPVTGFTLDTAATSSVTFTTEHGVFLECTNGPSTPLTYTNIIDWSAIPEVEIQYTESTEVTGGGTPSGDALNAQSVQSFPADTYFHYLSGQTVNHPAFEEFRGYPTKVSVYSDGTCIKGLALEFSFTNNAVQNVFLAGDETSLAGITPQEQTFSDRVTAVGATFGDAANGNCLSAIGFTEDGGGAASCLGQTCSESTTAPSGSHMSSLTVSTDSDGNVVAFTATWVSVDIPDLQATAGTTCPVTYTPSLGDIRASKFELTYNLAAEQTTCGTYSTIDGDTHVLTYANTVRRSRDSAGSTFSGVGVTISRSSAWQVDTTCTYTAENTVTSSYATKGEDAFKAVSLDAMEFTMSIYKDAQFSEPYSESSVPTLNLGDTVYLATTIASLDSYVVKNFECYATENADPTVKTAYYSLSGSDGCPAEASFAWDTAQSTAEKDAFHFDSFGWVKSNTFSIDTVYVHCTVRACPAESDSTCTARASNCPSDQKRARRDVTGLLPNGFHEKTISLDTPIFVKRRDVQALSINRDPVAMTENRSLLVATLFGQFALVTFICLMVIGYRVHSMRKGYYRLKNERIEEVSN